jgi:hypothetical protein
MIGDSSNSDDREICRYRLNGARSALEFYTSQDGALGADEVSKRALKEFLLHPFPAKYIRPEKL